VFDDTGVGPANPLVLDAGSSSKGNISHLMTHSNQLENMFGRIVDARRYEPSQLDLSDSNSSRTMMIELTGTGKTVLEIGTSTGYMSRVLKDRGNTVVGVEVDPEAAASARPHCDRLLNADIESLLLGDELEESFFDVVILGDVLEHLKWPDRVIAQLKSHLRPGGYLVVSMPNVAHGDVILNLLAGKFPYHDSGLLDITHLRFFGLEDVVKLFDSAGYRICDLHTVKVDVGCTETSPDLSTVPEEVLLGVKSLPHANSYQFVFKAFRAEECIEPLQLEDAGLKGAFEAFTTEVRRLRAENSRLDTYLAHLQPEFDEKAAWANKLNAELAEAQARAQCLQSKVDELGILWSRATRWKRALIFSVLTPWDGIVGTVIIAVELFGRVLRKISSRKAPLVAAQNSAQCSIVIVTWEGKDLLAESLPALREAVRFHGGEHEIVVVDNGSTDGTEEYLHHHFSEIRVIRNEQNEYFGGGNNLGVQTAKNDVVVLLNNDMIVHKDFLGPLLDGFRSPDVFAIASQVFLADPQKPREETGKTRATFNGCDLDWRHDPISRGDEEQNYVPVLWGHGGAVALDREKFLWIGGFDRLYDPFYVEDADLSYQAWKVGWRCMLAVDSKVIHKHRSSTKRFGAQFIAQIVRRNHELFMWKNFSDLPKLLKHFLRAYRRRIQRAGIPGIGIRLELRSFLGAVQRLPKVVSRRLRIARSIVRTDQEIFRLTNPPSSDSSSEVDFSRLSSQEQLGTGWYRIEISGQRNRCWMAQEASLCLSAPSETAELQLEGYVPPLSEYGGVSLTLTVCCGAERTRFDLAGGSFKHTWKITNLQVGKPTDIQLAVNKTIPPSPRDSRTLGLMFYRIALEGLNGQLSKTGEEDNRPFAGDMASCAIDSGILPDARKRLLFLCAYVPGIGLHGGGNTMFHLIRKLSDRYRITAVCLMEKEAEQKFVPRLAPFCERLEVMWRRQTLYARNPLGLRPPEIVYEFYHRRMQEVVDECLRSRSYDVIDCEYLQTAHFVQDYPEIPAVISHHEVYSLSYRNRYQSAPLFSLRRATGFANWMRMLNYEEKMFRRFYAVMVVTDRERDYLHHYMPQVKVYAHPTGVDCEFFVPSQEAPEPGSVVFLGNFNHAPNVSGILWFLERVWPAVRASCSYARLYVVGGNPPPSLQKWNGKEGVQVTGWVEDVRPFLQRSVVFIAPMLEGVGLRGKMLEAWATKKPVVGTSLAFLGLNQARDRAGFVADDAESFAARVGDLLANEALAEQMGTCGRELVISSYSWDAFADLYHRTYREGMEALHGVNEVMNTQVAGT
jgi:GT2 family glycosyltransferase/glycosyltransferase involved in cell wall biosynthesis/2-polyprenyl-3-methyl-5-hydroxy-6-metoxy-1,4-benzoquinol methylase